MSHCFDTPTTPTEAKQRGVTYFRCNKRCAVHDSPFRWASNGLCMACYDIDGTPMTQVLNERRKAGWVRLK